MPSDPSDIDTALLARLADDAPLKALVPDGVWWDVAPPLAKRFVIVSLVIGDAHASFDQGRAVEDARYLVKAVMLSGVPGANIKAAAARIDALLEDQPLTAPGFTWSTTHRDGEAGRIRHTEVDEVDDTIRWLHRGGYYRVQMAVSS